MHRFGSIYLSPEPSSNEYWFAMVYTRVVGKPPSLVASHLLLPIDRLRQELSVIKHSQNPHFHFRTNHKVVLAQLISVGLWHFNHFITQVNHFNHFVTHLWQFITPLSTGISTRSTQVITAPISSRGLIFQAREITRGLKKGDNFLHR